MDETSMFTVRATDGQAKCWMWDSRWYDLKPGEEAVHPAGPAFQAVAFYTTRDANGEKVSTVEAIPFTGEVRLQPVASTPPSRKFTDEDGTEYASLTALIAAVKERATQGSSWTPSGKSRP